MGPGLYSLHNNVKLFYIYRGAKASERSIPPFVPGPQEEKAGYPTSLLLTPASAKSATILNADETFRTGLKTTVSYPYSLQRSINPSDIIKRVKCHIMIIASITSLIALARSAGYSATLRSALAFHESLRTEPKRYTTLPMSCN